ncbi:MAG: Outer rane lipoprotein-sorting protein [Bacteroidetes bacterium]|nr:Outer rane lipoprotein-sorting protein [Bacteroidota bacterium]
MHKRTFAVVVLSVVVCCSLFAAEDTAQDVLERMRKKYDTISDAQLKFSQNTKFTLSKIEQHVNGTLFLKKTNKYRVETDDQTIVTNGETVWSYSAANKQVLIDHFKLDENSMSPEKVLTSAPTEYTSTLLGSEKIGKTDVVVLKLTPKNDQSLVKTMKLWVDNATWLIKKAEIVDVNGKQTEYLVTEVKVNTGLPDSRFTYQAPEGAEVVDLR